MAKIVNIPKPTSRLLLKKVTCPHCWSEFEPSDICWISRSEELIGDFLLGETEYERFLPARFHSDGNAVDRKGVICHEFACPNCHLKLPPCVLETRPFFISIVGAPASGKSYFLAAMTYQMERMYGEKFHISFTDADPQMNRRLSDYVTLQFRNGDPNALVKIDKTEEQGDLYNTIFKDGQQITYPQPFIFSLMPLSGHQYENQRQTVATSLCLYDNAGESYLPAEGADRSSLPVTRHLGRSNTIFFLFDPLQDNRLRELCRGVSEDPQLQERMTGDFRRSPFRQEQVLNEMVKRTRQFRNMTTTAKYPLPVVVIVTKFDAWFKLVPDIPRVHPWTKAPGTDERILDEKVFKEISRVTRNFLLKRTSEIVYSIESFASDVTYIPVSATGTPPVVDPQTQESGFRAGSIRPVWVELPILYALAKSNRGIVPIQ